MKLSRIDHIALNGGDGGHYKYEEVADKLIDTVDTSMMGMLTYADIKYLVIKILVEAFPNDET